jgi:formylglycine-generating enzyme
MGNNPSYFEDCPKCPVESVSWNDVQAFIRKLNDLTGLNYRLPTEAEWEYAARGGQDYKYAGSDNIETVAWYVGNSSSKTHPVGSKAANGYGLYDMSGNVWEWCSDWRGDYSSGSITNPRGPLSGSLRVMRGGSWFNSAKYCRVGLRYNNTPSYRRNYLGFRVVLSQ